MQEIPGLSGPNEEANRDPGKVQIPLNPIKSEDTPVGGIVLGAIDRIDLDERKFRDMVEQGVDTALKFVPIKTANPAVLSAISQLRKDVSQGANQYLSARKTIERQLLPIITRQNHTIKTAADRREAVTSIILERTINSRMKEVISTNTQILSVAQSQFQFQTGVQTNFMKQSLILGYEQLYHTRNMVTLTKAFAEMVENKLEAIKINTKLPDIAKASLFRRLKDAIVTEGFRSVGRAVAHRTGTYLKENVVPGIADYLESDKRQNLDVTGRVSRASSQVAAFIRKSETGGSVLDRLQGSIKRLSNIIEPITSKVSSRSKEFIQTNELDKNLNPDTLWDKTGSSRKVAARLLRSFDDRRDVDPDALSSGSHRVHHINTPEGFVPVGRDDLKELVAIKLDDIKEILDRISKSHLHRELRPDDFLSNHQNDNVKSQSGIKGHHSPTDIIRKDLTSLVNKPLLDIYKLLDERLPKPIRENGYEAHLRRYERERGHTASGLGGGGWKIPNLFHLGMGAASSLFGGHTKGETTGTSRPEKSEDSASPDSSGGLIEEIKKGGEFGIGEAVAGAGLGGAWAAFKNRHKLNVAKYFSGLSKDGVKFRVTKASGGGAATDEAIKTVIRNEAETLAKTAGLSNVGELATHAINDTNVKAAVRAAVASTEGLHVTEFGANTIRTEAKSAGISPRDFLTRLGVNGTTADVIANHVENGGSTTATPIPKSPVPGTPESPPLETKEPTTSQPIQQRSTVPEISKKSILSRMYDYVTSSPAARRVVPYIAPPRSTRIDPASPWTHAPTPEPPVSETPKVTPKESTIKDSSGPKSKTTSSPWNSAVPPEEPKGPSRFGRAANFVGNVALTNIKKIPGAKSTIAVSKFLKVPEITKFTARNVLEAYKKTYRAVPGIARNLTKTTVREGKKAAKIIPPAAGLAAKGVSAYADYANSFYKLGIGTAKTVAGIPGAVGDAAKVLGIPQAAKVVGNVLRPVGNVLGAVGKVVLKNLPIVSLAFSSYQIYDAIKRGDYGEAALRSVGVTASLVPGIGTVAGAVITNAVNAYEMAKSFKSESGRAGILLDVRMKAYGADSVNAQLIVNLESRAINTILKRSKIVNDIASIVLPDVDTGSRFTITDIEKFAKEFGFDTNNKKAISYFHYWLLNRFQLIVKSYLAILGRKGYKPEDLDKIPDDKFAIIFKELTDVSTKIAAANKDYEPTPAKFKEIADHLASPSNPINLQQPQIPPPRIAPGSVPSPSPVLAPGSVPSPSPVLRSPLATPPPPSPSAVTPPSPTIPRAEPPPSAVGSFDRLGVPIASTDSSFAPNLPTNNNYTPSEQAKSNASAIFSRLSFPKSNNNNTPGSPSVTHTATTRQLSFNTTSSTTEQRSVASQATRHITASSIAAEANRGWYKTDSSLPQPGSSVSNVPGSPPSPPSGEGSYSGGDNDNTSGPVSVPGSPPPNMPSGYLVGRDATAALGASSSSLPKGSVGSGQCVDLVKQAAGLGHTSSWQRGDSVLGNQNLKPGTAIACFDDNGKYGNHTDGRSHAAIYLGPSSVYPGGIRVYDQWSGQPAHIRDIRPSGGSAVNDASRYSIIKTPDSPTGVVAHAYRDQSQIPGEKIPSGYLVGRDATSALGTAPGSPPSDGGTSGYVPVQGAANANNIGVGYKKEIGGQTWDQKSPAIMHNLMRDFDLNKEQAAGIVGNLGHECGGLTEMQEKNPVGGGRGGLGWPQWTGPRRVAYENYCKSKGLDVFSDEANYGYLKKELSGEYASSIKAVKAAKTPDEAMRAFEKHYEAAGIKHYESRQKFTDAALRVYDAAPPTEPASRNASNQEVPGTPTASTNSSALGDVLGANAPTVPGAPPLTTADASATRSALAGGVQVASTDTKFIPAMGDISDSPRSTAAGDFLAKKFAESNNTPPGSPPVADTDTPASTTTESNRSAAEVLSRLKASQDSKTETPPGIPITPANVNIPKSALPPSTPSSDDSSDAVSTEDTNNIPVPSIPPSQTQNSGPSTNLPLPVPPIPPQQQVSSTQNPPTPQYASSSPMLNVVAPIRKATTGARYMNQNITQGNQYNIPPPSMMVHPELLSHTKNMASSLEKTIAALTGIHVTLQGLHKTTVDVHGKDGVFAKMNESLSRPQQTPTVIAPHITQMHASGNKSGDDDGLDIKKKRSARYAG